MAEHMYIWWGEAKKIKNKIKYQNSTQCFYLKIKAISLFYCSRDIYFPSAITRRRAKYRSRSYKSIGLMSGHRWQRLTRTCFIDFNSITYHQSILTDAQVGAAKGSPCRDCSEPCAGLEKVTLGPKKTVQFEKYALFTASRCRPVFLRSDLIPKSAAAG